MLYSFVLFFAVGHFFFSADAPSDYLFNVYSNLLRSELFTNGLHVRRALFDLIFCSSGLCVFERRRLYSWLCVVLVGKISTYSVAIATEISRYKTKKSFLAHRLSGMTVRLTVWGVVSCDVVCFAHLLYPGEHFARWKSSVAGVPARQSFVHVPIGCKCLISFHMMFLISCFSRQGWPTDKKSVFNKKNWQFFFFVISL